MQWVIAVAFGLAVASSACAAHQYKEKDYQEAFCAEIGGQTEVVLDDRTRVDCLTDEYAIEADFAPKWAESVGQALYYAFKTNRRPGVLLILEKPEDRKYLDRLQILAERHGIVVWTSKPSRLAARSASRGEITPLQSHPPSHTPK